MVCYVCLVVQAAVLSVLTVVTLYLWSRRHVLALAWGLSPVLPTALLMGHAHLIRHGLIGMVNLIIRSAVEFYETRSGNVTVLWLGVYPLVLVVGPADVQRVLSSEKALDKGPEMDDLKLFLGNGLLTSPGHHWRVIRRHFNPLFKPANLEWLVPVLNDSSRELTTDLTQLVGREQQDVLDTISPVALMSAIYTRVYLLAATPVISRELAACRHCHARDITFGQTICEPAVKTDLVFGSQTVVDRRSRSFTDLLRALDSVHRLIYARFMKIWLWPEISFRFFYKTQLQQIDKSISNFMQEHLKSADSAKLEDTRVDSDGFQGTFSDPKVSQMTLPEAYSALRKNYPGFTQEALQYEVVTFLTAGTEGVKATVASCLLALAANPSVQERLHAEIVSVVGSQDTDVTVKDLKDMPYLEQVLKETMRKFWIAPIVPRTLTEEITLSCGTVPAGVTLYMMPSVVHSDATHYPHPEVFDPDRFSSENTAYRDPSTFLPFGAGPRMCIAKSYSTLLIKILITHVLRRYRLSTDQDISHLEYRPGAIYLAVDGYPVRFTHRG